MEGPSYWGSLDDARDYAGPGGLVVRVDPERNPDVAAFGVNVWLLQAALDEGELTFAEAPTDWRTSVEVLGSARCEDRVPAFWLEESAARAPPSPEPIIAARGVLLRQTHRVWHTSFAPTQSRGDGSKIWVGVVLASVRAGSKVVADGTRRPLNAWSTP